MKLLLDDFQSVNFHDAKVLTVEERPEYIRVETDSALIRLPLNGSKQKGWLIYGCMLECFGVSKNKKEEWNDCRTPTSARSVSDPKYKIDELSDIEVKEDFLELAGHTHEHKWGIWRITAQHFELNWKSQKEFKRV